MSVLEKIFKKAYSINEMVKIAGDSRALDKYIYDLILKNKILKNSNSLKKIYDLKGLEKNYEKVIRIIKKRKKEVNEKLSKYNEINKNKLKIVYSIKSKIYLDNLYVNSSNYSEYLSFDGKIYNITEEYVKDYFYYMCLSMVPFSIIMIIIEIIRSGIKFEFSIIPIVLLIIAMFLRYKKQHTIVGCLTHLNPYESVTYMSLGIVLAFIIDSIIGVKEFNLISIASIILTLIGMSRYGKIKRNVIKYYSICF